MNIKNKVKGTIVAAFLLGSAVITNTALAQATTQQPAPKQQAAPAAGQQTKTDFTDAELQQFAAANNRLMVLQEQNEKAMMTILQEEKLEITKFNELAKAHQEQKLNEAKATPEEMAAFNKAAERIIAMQPTVKRDVQSAIEKDGMTLERYEQLLLAYQQNPEIQTKVNKLMGQ